MLIAAVVYLPLLLLFWLLARGLRGLVRRAAVRAGLDLQITILIRRIVFLGVFGLGVIAYVNSISGRVATVVLGAVGLLGLAFGLAFQDVLKNFLSGIFLLLERPFHIGDEIKIGDLSGQVETIRLRVTVLRGTGGQRILLPNQEVYNAAIVVSPTKASIPGV